MLHLTYIVLFWLNVPKNVSVVHFLQRKLLILLLHGVNLWESNKDVFETSPSFTRVPEIFVHKKHHVNKSYVFEYLLNDCGHND